MAKEHHRRHRVRPEDVVIFVELDDFTNDWQDLRFSDDDLHALQLAIIALGDISAMRVPKSISTPLRPCTSRSRSSAKVFAHRPSGRQVPFLDPSDPPAKARQDTRNLSASGSESSSKR